MESPSAPPAFGHQPVLAAAVCQVLNPPVDGAGAIGGAGDALPGGDLPSTSATAVASGSFPAPLLIDCTLGGGGHSALLLEAHRNWQLIGLDQDPTARVAAAERLAPYGDRVRIEAANFGTWALPVELRATAVLADLGVSSPQLDRAERGFSFRAEGPIDMRMNPEAGESAAELLDRMEEGDLADLLFQFGEERLSRRIARRLVAEREAKPWRERSTSELAYVVGGCYPPKARHGRIHPATRSFQALRIAVNDELGALERLLQRAPDWLKPGGLLAIISFHSLEDRLVKQAFLSDGRLERITRRPLVADPSEQEANPRSRSAKLRVARRLP